jgi:hypothetical protein
MLVEGRLMAENRKARQLSETLAIYRILRLFAA